MIEIYNITINDKFMELNNDEQKNIDKRKTYSKLVFGIALCVGLVVLAFTLLQDIQRFKPVAIFTVIFVLAIGFIWKAVRELRDVKSGFPLDDERVVRVRQIAGAKAFQASLWWLLIIIWVVSVMKLIELNTEEVLGLAVLGMAAIFGFMYLVTNRKSDNELSEK